MVADVPAIELANDVVPTNFAVSTEDEPAIVEVSWARAVAEPTKFDVPAMVSWRMPLPKS